MLPVSPETVVEPVLSTIPASPEKSAAELSIETYAITKAAALSYARYPGALGAEAPEWSAAQWAATHLYLRQAQTLIEKLGPSSQDIVSTLSPPTSEEIAAIRGFLTMDRLPSLEVEVLSRLGYTDQEIHDLTAAFLEANDAFFTSFVNLPQSLSNAATGFAIRLANLPASPGDSAIATIDVDPGTLNLKRKGNWITVYIEWPAGYNPQDIAGSSILLNGIVAAASSPTAIGDHDQDGIPDLMVKFDRPKWVQ